MYIAIAGGRNPYGPYPSMENLNREERDNL